MKKINTCTLAKPELVQRLDGAWQSWNTGMPEPAWKTPPESQWGLPGYQGPLWPEEKAALEKNKQARGTKKTK